MITNILNDKVSFRVLNNEKYLRHILISLTLEGGIKVRGCINISAPLDIQDEELFENVATLFDNYIENNKFISLKSLNNVIGGKGITRIKSDKILSYDIDDLDSYIARHRRARLSYREVS